MSFFIFFGFAVWDIESIWLSHSNFNIFILMICLRCARIFFFNFKQSSLFAIRIMSVFPFWELYQFHSLRIYDVKRGSTHDLDVFKEHLSSSHILLSKKFNVSLSNFSSQICYICGFLSMNCLILRISFRSKFHHQILVLLESYQAFVLQILELLSCLLDSDSSSSKLFIQESLMVWNQFFSLIWIINDPS